MKALLVLALLGSAGAASAQIPAGLNADPRVQAERQRTDAAARAAMTAHVARQADLTTRNLSLDRQAEPSAAARGIARADLDRERTEAQHEADAHELRRREQDRLRLERIDPGAAREPQPR